MVTPAPWVTGDSMSRDASGPSPGPLATNSEGLSSGSQALSLREALMLPTSPGAPT